MSLNCLYTILILFRVNTYDKSPGGCVSRGFCVADVMFNLIVEFLANVSGGMIFFFSFFFIEFLLLP